MRTVTVNAAALRQVLMALNGPAHYIRELQVTRNLPGSDNPINILTDEFNAAINAAPAHEEAKSAEPVAWMMETTHKTSGEKSVWISTDRKGWSNMESVTYGPQVPLYLHPPTDKKDEALRVAMDWINGNCQHHDRCDVLYLDDDGNHMKCSCGLTEALAAIRAALGEKE